MARVALRVVAGKQRGRPTGGKGGSGGKKPKKAGGDAEGGGAGAPQQRQGAAGQSSAPRITGRVAGASVKRQVALVRMRDGAAGGSRFRRKKQRERPTAYRRVLTEEEERERRRRAALKASPLALKTLYADGTATPSVMLVDGYNVCGQWPLLKERFFGGDLAGARDLLVEQLADYSHIRGLAIQCVFDGAGFRGHRDNGDKEMGAAGIEVVQTSLATADMYIEQEARRLVELDCPPPSVWVATGDRPCANCVVGLGGYAISSKFLITDIKRVQREADENIRRMNAERKAPRVGILVGADATTAAKLDAIRMGKPWPPPEPEPQAPDPELLEEEEELVNDGWEDAAEDADADDLLLLDEDIEEELDMFGELLVGDPVVALVDGDGDSRG